MKLYKLRSGYFHQNFIRPVVIFISIFVLMLFGIRHFEMTFDEQKLILTEQAIRRSIVQCYANEGFYPVTLNYLEVNYNLDIDKSSYYVYYEYIASNLIPDVAVYKK